MDYKQRQSRLQGLLAPSHLDALLLTHLPNVRYLCGFSGSAGALIVTEERCVFLTDGRYTEQARDEVKGAKVKVLSKSPLAGSADWLAENRKVLGRKRLGIEATHLCMADHAGLKKTLGPSFHLRPAPALVERMRMVKDSEEIACIREAVILGARLFESALQTIRAGVPETEVAGEMEYMARQGGADGMSFDTIVASGPRSARPHGRASSNRIPSKGFVVCDFGVILAGYCSDMTRTVHVGAAARADRDFYEAVQGAQQAAVQAVRPGISVAEVDQAARNVLKKRGLGRYFTHSTGHGVGLEIHEAPRVAAGQNEVLQPGMVITIEPGAYVAGRGGVRIEDMVFVVERGCEVLTPTPKELITI
jgi:Xaa-Pro aminopeptidase